MRILIQRVSRASVSVEGEIIGKIGPGLVVFVGIKDDDSEETAKWMAEKVANLRIFEDNGLGDDAGKMNLSAIDIGSIVGDAGSALVISQFTLYGDVKKGNRPNFMTAAQPEKAEAMYEIFLGCLTHRLGTEKVASGRFRANMSVELVNEGPVTILVER
jgi:D-aminoacyl-tRNA deacylase